MILEALALIGLILFFPIWFFGRNTIKKILPLSELKKVLVRVCTSQTKK